MLAFEHPDDTVDGDRVNEVVSLLFAVLGFLPVPSSGFTVATTVCTTSIASQANAGAGD